LTGLDGLHEVAGVTEYPNKEWIGNSFGTKLFSPIYCTASLVFYAMHVWLVGIPSNIKHVNHQGLLGGHCLDLIKVLYTLLRFTVAYGLTALLGGFGNQHTFLPFICVGLLLALAFHPVLKCWNHCPKFGFVKFLSVVVVCGVAFEWMAVANGGFKYGSCPSISCIGTPVALSWLPFLYLHAGIAVHELMTNHQRQKEC